ncbi:hypothetical protein PTSG_02113 [Salpingoeca rosetta]|uniref:CRAL-TRIO domain-containing protein n=1 Tax=Salpingoeca rosetta (strain ATCC 50818 / BSB-021) TaxID=946362 RepID=F2U191_SALR5|nr:uncharacterized protein PTSG_02113 [Salpingoeca rosetta]EGD81393.1 hypothetical protein PTSG_02113 [Salpingoeca rosetta]|eukprot:XP_004996597.1 hypothetical protein PTSG_02113 [Salpingoeca rosetta]
MGSREEVDARLAMEEVTPLQEEEKEYKEAIIEALTPEQAEKMTELDFITIIRGYQTYNPRKEETVKAAKMIADWRDKVDYYHFLDQRLEKDEMFHKLWPESIYGEDKYGHPIVYMRVSEIDTDKLAEMNEEHMLRLQGQKQTAYLKYKEDISKRRGEQRYKYILIVDLKGTGMGILGGKKRGMLQKIFAVGADNFPESIWKIFVINTPFLFRTVWAMIKPWIHPITQAKINIHGGVSDAVKKMKEAGISATAIPELMGGSCKPVNTFEYMIGVIKANQEAAAEGGADADAAADDDEGDGDDAQEESADKAADDMGHLAVV